MKKEFLQLLKIAKMPKQLTDAVRFYTAVGFIWAHRVGNGLDLVQRLGPVGESRFDICVDAELAKAYAGLDKELTVDFDNVLLINGQSLPPVETPLWYEPKQECLEDLVPDYEISELDAGTLAKIQSAAEFTASPKLARPMFENVYLDHEYVVGTNTYVLYKALHSIDTIKLPVYIPKDLVPFLTEGFLTAWTTKTKAKDVTRHYRFAADDRQAEWSSTFGAYPNFRGLVCEGQNEETTLELIPAHTQRAKKLVAIAKAGGCEYNIIKFSDVFPNVGVCRNNGEYLLSTLKVFGKELVAIYWTDVKSKPIFIECGDATVILTPIKEKE